MSVAVVAGGVGAARLLRGLVRAVPPAEVTAVVNVGDDLELHGLHVSPDIDTIVYTLAGAIDPERGWGLVGETWQAAELLARYGNPTWFQLGDRDLATHIVRTERLRAGQTLSAVTAHLCAAWGLGLTVLPVTDDPVRTMVTVADEGEISFQEYFVRRRHDVAVRSLRFAGATTATPAPGVLQALDAADRVVIAPSNPLVSVEPVLAVPGVRDALAARRADAVAVSPIVGGRALKGPADRLLTELGHESSVVGVARLYAPLVSTLVVDTADAELAADVAATGVTPVVTPTVMSDPAVTLGLARTVLGDASGAVA